MKNVKILAINPYDTIKYCENRPMEEANFFQLKGCDVEFIILERKIVGKKVFINKINDIKAVHFICKNEILLSKVPHNIIGTIFIKIIYFWWYLSFIVWLKRYLKNQQIDSLICHNLEMALAGVLAGKSVKNIVFVMREHYEWQVKNKLKSWMIQKISRWIQNRSNYLVHVSPVQYSMTQRKNRGKVLYIPNYPKAENYSNVNTTLSDKIRINYIGSVRDIKSLKMLMDAAKGIDEIEIGIHGMGEAYPSLKAIENQYNNVMITGYYDHNTESKKLFSNTDIVYCAYDIDVPNWGKVAYPIKMYEAIEVGVPVMLCKGMVAEKFVIDNECGFVFPYNVKSLRNMILDIVAHREKLDEKRRNIQKLKGRYVWDKVVREYEKVIS